MKSARVVIVAVSGIASLSALGAWSLWPAAPMDTPYFHWQPDADDRYELVVSHVEGNPEFQQGVTTTPVPRSGTLRVVGREGAADPGAIVEVSNPRTRRGYAVTADAGGAFSVEAEARRGDSLRVISRRIRFGPLEPPRAQGVRD